MKKYVFAACFLAATAISVASGGSVFGNGGVSNPKEGVATFWLNIQEDNLASARFVFAAEGMHHDYPDVVFKSINVDSYMVMGNEIMVRGQALLYHMIPVDYMAHFIDGGRTSPDRILLHAWNTRNFVHIVHFESNLTAGNIFVNPGK